ncbi:MAG TPA: TonB-dependent receptor [Holophagaceae bacterium]
MRPRAATGLALLLAPALAAQGLVSGGLRGVVRSADGTPLAGVRLTLVENATRRQRSLVTGPDGAFRFRGIEPGTCRLEVTAGDSGGQRITGLRIHPGADTALDVELMPMEPGMVLDVEAPDPPVAAAETSLATDLSAGLLQALPLRSRDLAAVADLGPWPAAPAPNLRVDGLDLGAAGTGPSPLGLAALEGVRILAGDGPADQPGGAALQATTRGGGDAFEGTAQALWGPASGVAADRREAGLTVGGPLHRDRLFYAVAADRQEPGDGSRSTHGTLRVDWLPGDAQRWTLRALDADGDGAGRDASLALAHRWTPTPGFVQEARLQGRRVEAPGLSPARSWEAADTLALDLGAHGLAAGLDLQQVRSEVRPGEAWRRAGLFLQDDWRPAEPFTLRVGLRRDLEDTAEGGRREATSPRLAFSWRVTARVRLYGGHGRFVDPSPLAFFQPLPPLVPPDRRESHLGLAFLPLPDLALTAEVRNAEGRLLPGGGDRDRLRGLALGGRWQVREVLNLAASWTLARTRSIGPLGPQDGTLRRLRLWAAWDTRDLASPWARDWTLALVGRRQSGQPDAPAGPVRTPEGSAVLDLRIARAFAASFGRAEVLLDAFDLLDRTRPATHLPADAGRRVQIGLRASF